jgi:hypothetical protein
MGRVYRMHWGKEKDVQSFVGKSERKSTPYRPEIRKTFK